MKEITFEEHVEILKKNLKLDENLKVFGGNFAIGYAEWNDEIYLKNHDVSLKDKFDGVNGLYLWMENENTVLVKDITKIGTLAHEMRHAWQYKNKGKCKFWFLKSNTKLKKFVNRVGYFISEKELDAHKYARDYCRVNCQYKTVRKYSFRIGEIRFYRLIPLIFYIYFYYFFYDI